MLDGLRFIYQDNKLIPEKAKTSCEQEIAQPPIIVECNGAQDAFIGEEIQDQQDLQDVEPTESASLALAKDAAMNRMVDDLVGRDHELDVLPKKAGNLPHTPPAQTFEETALIDETSYGLAQLTGSEVIDMMQGSSQKSAKTDPKVAQFHSKFSPNLSPPIRTVPYLPSLPDQSSIWNPSHEASTPTSPLTLSGSRSLTGPGTGTPAHSRSHSLHSSMAQQLSTEQHQLF